MFFKKRCHCNQHDDLIKLQELNKELKELQEKKRNLYNLPPLNIDNDVDLYETCIGKNNSFKRSAAIIYDIESSLRYGKTPDLAKILFIDCKQRQFEIEYLKEIGKALINYADTEKEYIEVEERIEEIKEEIKELKKKLGIE